MKKRWSSVDTHQPTDVIEETTVISLIGKFDQENYLIHLKNQKFLFVFISCYRDLFHLCFEIRLKNTGIPNLKQGPNFNW